MTDSRNTGKSTVSGAGETSDGMPGPITPLPPPLVCTIKKQQMNERMDRWINEWRDG